MQTSQACLKNIKFGNELRSRHRHQYIRRLRQELLLQPPVSTQLCLSTLPELLRVPPSQQAIQSINSIIISPTNHVNQQLLEPLFGFLTTHFIEVPNQRLCSEPYCNDIVALLSNALAISGTAVYLRDNLNFSLLANKTFQLILISSNASRRPLIWLLVSLLKSGPPQLAIQLSSHQLQLRNFFQITDPFFVHFILELSSSQEILVETLLLDELMRVQIGSCTKAQFCLSVVGILEGAYRTGNAALANSILEWANVNMFNRYVPAEAKSGMLSLLYLLARKGLDPDQLVFMAEGPILGELIQRSQYDSVFYNKCMSLFTLSEVIRTMPFSGLEGLIFSNLQLISILVDCLSLDQSDIVLDCLRSLTRVILAWPSNQQIWNCLQNSGLEPQVRALLETPSKEIYELAVAILEEYLHK